MGKLRTANNRRNRAIRQTVARTRAAAVQNVTAEAAMTAAPGGKASGAPS